MSVLHYLVLKQSYMKPSIGYNLMFDSAHTKLTTTKKKLYRRLSEVVRTTDLFRLGGKLKMIIYKIDKIQT